MDHKRPNNRTGMYTGLQQKRYTMDTVNTRSRSRDLERKRDRVRSQSPNRAMASLNLLKSSLKVQNALS
jgi:hypothetical protein